MNADTAALNNYSTVAEAMRLVLGGELRQGWIRLGGRNVYWTGRVAIGLRYAAPQPAQSDAPAGCWTGSAA